MISFLSPEQDDFADDDEPVRRGAGVAGGRKASPAAKKSAISPPRGVGRNARRGPALAGDFAEDGIDDDDAALFGDEIDEGDALFVDEDDDGLLGDDEPLFADEVGGRAGAVGGRRSKGAAAGSATMAGKKKNNGPGQKKTPLQPEPDFRSGGAKAPLVGAARARGSSSDLTNAAAVGGAGRSRSNALPIAAATLDSRTNGRPASGTEDLDATAAANPLPRKLITSDLITMRNDDDMRVSGDSALLLLLEPEMATETERRGAATSPPLTKTSGAKSRRRMLPSRLRTLKGSAPRSRWLPGWQLSRPARTMQTPQRPVPEEEEELLPLLLPPPKPPAKPPLPPPQLLRSSSRWPTASTSASATRASCPGAPGGAARASRASSRATRRGLLTPTRWREFFLKF